MVVAESVKSPELVLSHLDRLPTLPAVAVRLLQLTATEDSTAGDVVKLLRSDQSLTAKILSLASSASSGVRSPVTTLEKAVPLLGFSTLRSVVLATSVFHCFTKPGEQAPGTFDRMEFWKHSLAVACAARLLARAAGSLGIDPEDAFVAGLLHDLGKVALDTVFPKAYDRIATQADHSRGDISDSEREILGVDHTVAGRRVAERWRLPREFQEVIWLHHLTAGALPATVQQPRLIALVQLADTLAREQRIGYSGNHMFYEMSPRLAERLELSGEDVNSVLHSLAHDVAEHATLLGLDGETAESVYFEMMSRANAELGRVNAELISSNRRLAASARFFKASALFEEELRDWSDPAAVVAAFADAAAMALQRPRVAAFGLRDNASALDLCWGGSGAEDLDRTTQTVPHDLQAWLGEFRDRTEMFVIQAPPVLRSLLVLARDEADEGTLWLLPIRHSGELAGGVLYFSEVDERQRLHAEADDLRSFLAGMGLALGRANAQAAARRLSEDLAETNRRLQQMQSELLRSRTLSMIAGMAAGAGHELNSPLTVISGRAQMLASSLKDPDAQRALKAISDKAHECSGIVSELMNFAKPPPAKKVPFDLAGVLADVRMEWLERSSGPASRVRLEAATSRRAAGESGGETAVVGDPAQIKTVVRELVGNASDAVDPERGTITLRCRPAVQANMVELLVEDNGCGMAPAVLQRAFDPFYSHRKAGRRRGLGLPRAYRIVESHGGRIWLESRPDEGTTAHVLLPRAAGRGDSQGRESIEVRPPSDSSHPPE